LTLGKRPLGKGLWEII